MTASRPFIVEPAFCERDKNHKLDNFKTHKNLFFRYCTVYKVPASLCIQSECNKIRTLFMQRCAMKDAN